MRRTFKKGKWSAPDVVELSDVASIVPNAGPSSSIAKLANCGKGGSIPAVAMSNSSHVQTTRNRHCIRPMSILGSA